MRSSVAAQLSDEASPGIQAGRLLVASIIAVSACPTSLPSELSKRLGMTICAPSQQHNVNMHTMFNPEHFEERVWFGVIEVHLSITIVFMAKLWSRVYFSCACLHGPFMTKIRCVNESCRSLICLLLKTALAPLVQCNIYTSI